MSSNPLLAESALELKRAYRKSSAKIWLRLKRAVERPASMKEVNLSKLSKVTEEGDVVVVPGKVLGSGNIDHKVTLYALSLSHSAAKKIVDAGGKILTLKQFIESFPEGSKVKIVG